MKKTIVLASLFITAVQAQVVSPAMTVEFKNFKLPLQKIETKTPEFHKKGIYRTVVFAAGKMISDEVSSEEKAAPRAETGEANYCEINFQYAKHAEKNEKPAAYEKKFAKFSTEEIFYTSKKFETNLKSTMKTEKDKKSFEAKSTLTIHPADSDSQQVKVNNDSYTLIPQTIFCKQSGPTLMSLTDIAQKNVGDSLIILGK